MAPLVLTITCALLASPASPPAGPAILPLPPESAERLAPIEALEKKGPELAAAFASHVHRNAKGESMWIRRSRRAGLPT